MPAECSDYWNAGEYSRFSSERLQPFFELLRLVNPAQSMRVVDLGCGTGEATEILHRELKAAYTLGLDNSAAMLEQAYPRAGDRLEFVEGEFQEFRADGEYDLVFSNAALHWAEDHPAIIARWYGALKPGGQLAIQLPANQPHLTQVVARDLAVREPFASVLAGRTPQPGALAVERYAEILHALGATKSHVRLQVFCHELDGADAAVDWVRGSLLTGYRRLLGDQLYAEFESAYRAEVTRQIGSVSPYLLTYRRILIHALRTE